MQPIDLLVEARWVLPMEPANAVLENHAIAIDAGRILELGVAGLLRKKYAPRTLVQRPAHALLPGLVNAHTHAAMTLIRGAAVKLPVQRWLRESIWPLENRWIGPEFVRTGTRLAMAEMLAAGITCFADMYLFPEEVARLCSELKLRAAVGLPIADAPTAWAANAGDYLDKAGALWDQRRSDPWVKFYFAPHAPYSLSDVTLQRLRKLADQLDAPMAMHVHESAAEVGQSLAEHGVTPLQRLEHLGLLRPGFMAIHMNSIDARDIALAARSGLTVVHCPQSNLRLGGGACPVPALRAAGVSLALGTDSAASTGALDVLAEARLASLLCSGLQHSHAPPTAMELLGAATLGGATALGLERDIGSLAPGKAADVICVALDQFTPSPAQGVADEILFQARSNAIYDVWASGTAAVSAGEFVFFATDDLRAQCADWARRLQPGVAA